jgi:IS30 family transposase
VAGYSPYAAAQQTSVCAETIYRGIYTGRLGVDPTAVLRTRRPKRRHRHLRQPTSDGNYLGAFTPISARPEIIENRTQVGHWEGDLITGTANQSAIITLTERHTRYQVALTLPDGHSADHTITQLTHWVSTHSGIVLSLTWDRGAELTRWTRLRDHHGITVYFCDPKSPWQRATNENANRQLRFWFPRRTDLSIYTQTDLNRACHILNTTPRRIHNNQTAQHIYHHHTRTHH